MSAAVASPLPHGEGLAARRALRDARIRGATFLALGVASFYFASSSFQTPAIFGFRIYTTGRETFEVATSVGLLWMIAGLAAALVGALQLWRGATFRWVGRYHEDMNIRDTLDGCGMGKTGSVRSRPSR